MEVYGVAVGRGGSWSASARVITSKSRAAGRRPGDGGGGDRFKGRTAAIARVLEWMGSSEAPGTPLVVTGQPGAGKSSVVARAAHDLDKGKLGGGLFFHARSATHADLLAAAAQATGTAIADAGLWREHLERQAATGRDRRFLLVVDALDEAASRTERTAITQTLMTVAGSPVARVMVATRRGKNDELLAGLGVRAGIEDCLVDLDAPAYFDINDLRDVAAAQLTQNDAVTPGPMGRAWASYRQEPNLTARLAGVIADRAERNFLVAAFAAHTLSTNPTGLEPAGDHFDVRQMVLST